MNFNSKTIQLKIVYKNVRFRANNSHIILIKNEKTFKKKK